MSTPNHVSSPASQGAPSIDRRNVALVNTVELIGRSLLVLLFLLSGIGKLGAYTATAAYMSAHGVAGILLPLVIATEVLGAASIVLGWKTRVVAFLLAGFSLLTALTFHSNFADQTQMIMFFKNIAIAGGFLLLVAHGAGALSVDERISKRS